MGLVAALMTLAGAGGAIAETETVVLDIEQLINLEVVTAARKLQKINEAPSIITTFRREDIDKMAVESLIDVLRFAPGIETSIGPDGRYRVAIRGERKDGNILLLVDGHAVNDPYDGSADFDLPVSFIERVEIIRGPGSALYGTNAVVGVVNVFTARERRDAAITAGTRGQAAAGANYAFGTREAPIASLSLGYAATDRGGDKVAKAQQAGAAEKTDYFRRDGLLSAGFQRQGLRLSTVALHRTRGAWTGPLFELTNENRLEATRGLVDASYEVKAGKKLKLLPKVSLALLDREDLHHDHPAGFTADGNVFADGARTREDYSASTLGAELSADYAPTEDMGILAGLVGERQKMESYKLVRDYQVIGMVPKGTFGNHDGVSYDQRGKDRRILAAYAQGDYRWAKANLTLGFRLDDYSDFGSSFNPRVGLVVRPWTWLGLKALYAHAFRAPTFRELFDDTSVGNRGVRSNADLAPEKIRTAELGAEVRAAWVVVRGNVFYNRIEDAIGVYDPEGSGAPGDMENLGQLKSWGGELEILAVPSTHFSAFLNVADIRTEFEWSSDPKFDRFRQYLASRGHKRMVNSPSFLANVGADARFGQLEAFVGLQNAGKSGANDRSPIEGIRAFSERIVIEDYLRLAVSLSYSLPRGIKLRLSGTGIDLWDHKHADPDESTNINFYGPNGMSQPGAVYALRLVYSM